MESHRDEGPEGKNTCVLITVALHDAIRDLLLVVIVGSLLVHSSLWAVVAWQLLVNDAFEANDIDISHQVTQDKEEACDEDEDEAEVLLFWDEPEILPDYFVWVDNRLDLEGMPTELIVSLQLVLEQLLLEDASETLLVYEEVQSDVLRQAVLEQDEHEPDLVHSLALRSVADLLLCELTTSGYKLSVSVLEPLHLYFQLLDLSLGRIQAIVRHRPFEDSVVYLIDLLLHLLHAEHHLDMRLGEHTESNINDFHFVVPGPLLLELLVDMQPQLHPDEVGVLRVLVQHHVLDHDAEVLYLNSQVVHNFHVLLVDTLQLGEEEGRYKDTDYLYSHDQEAGRLFMNCDVGKRDYSDPVLLATDHEDEVLAGDLLLGDSVNALVADQLVELQVLIKWINYTLLLVMAVLSEVALENT
mmetsp:Transcript_5131/g.7845  ORF Transcript_5131/g.7845 Transcript_5131/m.7845 type:complete len:413 (-) Transcript_5131:3614-4852(-)